MSRETRGERRGGALLVAAGAALWGTDGWLRTPLVSPGSVFRMSSPAVVLAEHVVLFLFALPAIVINRRHFTGLRASQWFALFLIAAGGSAFATVLFTQAFSTGDYTTPILLQKVQPLIVIGLANVFLREPMGRYYWPLFALAMIGAYFVAFGTLEPIWNLPSAQVVVAALAVGAAALWGASTVCGRYMLADVPFVALTAARFLFALPVLAALAFVDGSAWQVAPGFAVHPMNLVLMGLGPGLLALLLYYRGLSSTPASVATIAELSFPTSAIILGYLSGQSLKETQAIGLLILWGAIIALDRLNVSTAPAPLRAAAAGAD